MIDLFLSFKFELDELLNIFIKSNTVNSSRKIGFSMFHFLIDFMVHKRKASSSNFGFTTLITCFSYFLFILIILFYLFCYSLSKMLN